jgi:predicted regulator of Ras-like GTPase activity (Roadblock/LC7/MglB family)
VAFKVGGEFNAKVISAISAITRSTIERLGAELNLGDSIIAIMQRKKLLLAPLGKELILIAIVRPDPNLGLILLKIEELTDKLLKVLGE